MISLSSIIANAFQLTFVGVVFMGTKYVLGAVVSAVGITFEYKSSTLNITSLLILYNLIVKFKNFLANVMMFAGAYIGNWPFNQPVDGPLSLKGFILDEALGYYYYVHDPKRPSIVFLHGNGADASQEGFTDLAYAFKNKGYNVASFEYDGYGCLRGRTAPTYEKLPRYRQQIQEQWKSFASKVQGDIYISGVSLGGGFAWSSCDILSPAPKKLVLINTFADLSIFVNNFIQGSILYNLFVPKELLDYKISNHHKSWNNGTVIVVYTADDELFDERHAGIFKHHFSKFDNIKYKECKINEGGHNGGPWLDHKWLESLEDIK